MVQRKPQLIPYSIAISKYFIKKIFCSNLHTSFRLVYTSTLPQLVANTLGSLKQLLLSMTTLTRDCTFDRLRAPLRTLSSLCLIKEQSWGGRTSQCIAPVVLGLILYILKFFS